MSYNNGCSDCILKHPKPKGMIIECGEGTGSKIFTSSDDTAFQLAHVTLDTTSLKRSEVLIKFSSIISMERIDEPATLKLQYELFRTCDGEELKSLGTWMFEEVNVINRGFDHQEESFSFILCESLNSLRCQEYFVTVTPIEITNARATVSNGRIAALSQSLCDELKYENKTKDLKYDAAKFEENYPKPKEVLLACGQGNGSVIFKEEPEVEPPIDIAHVTIDTTCINSPKVLIEFSSIIKIDNEVFNISLQFELFRVCGDGEALSLGIWKFERTGVDENIELTKSFDFTFCDFKALSSCCEYFVRITPIEIATLFSGVDVTVDNARIVAIAQSSKNHLYYYDGKSIDRKGDCFYCVQKSPKPKKILLECGEGNGSKIFTKSSDSPLQLAHVTIDTTSLCSPIVNIEFSSIVSFERSPNRGDGRLRYELFKVCDNGSPIPIGIWMSERTDITNFDRSTNIFNFTFCDCITCPGCCNYFVTVTPIRIEDAIVTVSNGRMAALVVEA